MENIKIKNLFKAGKSYPQHSFLMMLVDRLFKQLAIMRMNYFLKVD